MSFFIQHGYGKAQKINTLMSQGFTSGVILSPGDEDPSSLRATAEYCAQAGLRVFIDPQTYVYSTNPQGAPRNHPAHHLKPRNFSWAQSAESITRHIAIVGELNKAINPSGIWIAPAALQSTFTDVWTPLSIQFARTASDAWGGERTMVTLAIEESALSDWARIEDWLDVATTLDVAGFYVLVSRNESKYPGLPWAPTRLANLLRLVHTLGTLNQFEVIWGYSDLEGMLGVAAGASGMAAGWSYTLRQFSASKWQSTPGGGKPATVRVHVPRLWSLLRAETEAADIFNSAMRSQIFYPDQIEDLNRQPFSSISRPYAQEQHLMVLAERANSLGHLPTQAERLDTVQNSLILAIELFEGIGRLGLLTDPRYKARVQSLSEAMTIFRRSESL